MTRGTAVNGAVPSASSFAMAVDHVLIERLADRARLLRAIEHGDRTHRRRQRGDEVARR